MRRNPEEPNNCPDYHPIIMDPVHPSNVMDPSAHPIRAINNVKLMDPVTVHPINVELMGPVHPVSNSMNKNNKQ